MLIILLYVVVFMLNEGIKANTIYTDFKADNDALSILNSIQPSIARIEITKNNTLLSALLNGIQNSNISNKIAFELSKNYHSSIQINDFFTSLTSNVSVVTTHVPFDCDLNKQTNVTFNGSSINILCLSSSLNQVYLSLSSFLNKYQYVYYAIIYESIDYYERFALELSHLFGIDSFVLDFSLVATSSLITNRIKHSNANVIFLLFECGNEANFLQAFSNISTNVIYMSIYNSPKCNSIVNSNDTFNERLLKLIPIDINEFTYELTSLNTSLNRENLMRTLVEIESYDYLNNYEKNTSNFSLDCTYYLHDTDTRLCQRQFNFYLFQYDTSQYIFKEILFFAFNANSTRYDINYTNNTLEWSLLSFYGEEIKSCANQDELNFYKTIVYIFVGIGCMSLATLAIIYSVRNHLAKRQLAIGPNKMFLSPDDLEFLSNKSRLQFSNEKSNLSMKSETDLITSKMAARFKDDIVFVKVLSIPNFQLNGRTMRDLRSMRELRHENVNGFIGYLDDPRSPSILFEYASRGSLSDILAKTEIKLDWNFKWSMMNDLCRAMKYLHHSSIKYHGNLKSKNCVVDSKWVLKITDFGLPGIHSSQNYRKTVELGELLWTAPEHLRACTIKDKAVLSEGSPQGDVYSFSIIMQEIILRGPPFCSMDLTHAEIIKKLCKPPPLLRPSVSKQAATPEYINIMKQCWIEQPDVRPSFDTLHQQFKQLNSGKKVNIVDIMFKQLEQYSTNLEDSIKERTLQLEEEKKKTENLLIQMLPRTVAESLLKNKPVPPESYECVTIYFSDIVGFTTISAFSSPIEVVNLLNDLYTMFDSILTDFDCYKVETIGDAYMVVSGLPHRNGNRHAGEIATMALNLLYHCGQFRIQHLPGIPLRLRIGIHSGACVTGVVGLKMPRYCLFGDTVNTASRMESTSMAFRIHVSEAAAKILREIGGYHLQFRGETELKGKGKHKTYWLTGKDDFDKELPKPYESENNHGIDDELLTNIKRIREENLQRERQELNAVAPKPLQLPEIVQAIKKIDKHDSGFSEHTNSSNENPLPIIAKRALQDSSQTNLVEVLEQEKKKIRKSKKIAALTNIDSFT